MPTILDENTPWRKRLVFDMVVRAICTLPQEEQVKAS